MRKRVDGYGMGWKGRRVGLGRTRSDIEYRRTQIDIVMQIAGYGKRREEKDIDRR